MVYNVVSTIRIVCFMEKKKSRLTGNVVFYQKNQAADRVSRSHPSKTGFVRNSGTLQNTIHTSMFSRAQNDQTL